LYQKAEHVQKFGEKGAPWYVGWYEPGGTRKSKSFGANGKKYAEQFRRKIEAQLLTDTYEQKPNTTWEEFRKRYEERILAGLSPNSRKQAKTALDHFERIVRPKLVYLLCTEQIDRFIAERRTEKGLKRDSIISPASVNADLRQIKAALNVAVEWGFLRQLPRFRMEREPKKLATYVNGEHFANIYQACEKARMPKDIPNVAASDWWRSLLVFGYMTGWRIGETLALKRDDLDLESGTAITRADATGNKGKRDERIRLHPVVLDHLRKMACFDPRVFPWNHNRRTLHAEFLRIQEAAGIHLPCDDPHQHTPYCHVYGFHDLRRAFATMNADKLTADALQALMRHKSYQTTQVYINMARQMDDAVAVLHVPDVLKKGTGQC
jgi:integrase